MVLAHSSVYDTFVDFIIGHMQPDDLINFTLPPEIELRIDTLMDKHQNSRLTAEEYAELEEYRRAEHMLRRMKLKVLLSQK